MDNNLFFSFVLPVGGLLGGIATAIGVTVSVLRGVHAREVAGLKADIQRLKQLDADPIVKALRERIDDLKAVLVDYEGRRTALNSEVKALTQEATGLRKRIEALKGTVELMERGEAHRHGEDGHEYSTVAPHGPIPK